VGEVERAFAKTMVPFTGDRGFESRSLQRGVICEPDLNHRHIRPFPHLAHRSAAAHKLHSTPQQDRMNLISGNGETSSRRRPLAYSSPEAVQTTGTVEPIDDRRPRPGRDEHSSGDRFCWYLLQPWSSSSL